MECNIIPEHIELPARPLKELSSLIEALLDKGLDITGKVFGIPVELHLQIPK